jgi:hypothetical protein
MSAEPFVHRDPKLPFAKTAANGRDGGLPTLDQAMVNREVAPIPAGSITIQFKVRFDGL